MDAKFTNYLKISIIILTVFVLLWGLFYFLGSKKNLVSENIYEKNVEVLDTEEIDIEIENEQIYKNVILEEDNLKKEIKSKESSAVTKENEEKEKKNVSFFEIKDSLVSWGFTTSSSRKIDTIVLHSSYNALGGDEYNLDKLVAIYKEYGVAPHYLIDREGDIYRLVEDKNVAYHAGVSEVPDGESGVNDFSIGIELINTKTDDYESDQYDAVNRLIKEIKKDYNIKYILGHNEIAPDRKTDPWNINWNKVDR